MSLLETDSLAVRVRKFGIKDRCYLEINVYIDVYPKWVITTNVCKSIRNNLTRCKNPTKISLKSSNSPQIVMSQPVFPCFLFISIHASNHASYGIHLCARDSRECSVGMVSCTSTGIVNQERSEHHERALIVVWSNFVLKNRRE